MSGCTDFCTSLNSLPCATDATPSREELLEHLPTTEGVHEWYMGTWSDLQQRSSCEFCKLVVAAIAESVQQAEDEVVRPDQPISILLFPDEASLRLSFPSPLSARLAFVGDNVSDVRSPDTARPIHQEGIDLDRIRSWLKTCDGSHASCSWRDNITEPTGSTAVPHDGEDYETPWPHQDSQSYFKKNFNEAATSNFRVIDVEVGCIKHVPLDVRYVALSYVWGQLPMIQLRRDNFKRLTSEGGLDEIRQQLPQTITDAIDLLRALGIRYLWIDGLCLIQDDKRDVSLGIRMMNTIYHGSYFTTVAASGQDANAGLCGFRQGSACSERRQTIARVAPGIQLTVLHSIDWHLSRSIYNQRGWTLQELVLPDRTLIFINGQAYFRCHEANWSEETWADKWTHWLDADDSNISRVPDPVEGFLPSCWAYQKLCEDFSLRKLRNDEDALRAFEGVTRPMAAGMETDLIEGLPGYYLDHFLLFISTTGNMRRRPQFASFTWAGWDGAKMWPRENFEWPNVTANGAAASERQTENILRFLQYNRLVEWTCVGVDSCVEQLTEHRYDAPSLVLELMQKYPGVFANLDEDPVARYRRETLSRFGGTCSSSGIPRWGSRSYEWQGETHVDPGAGHHKTKPLPEFCMKALDLANSQAEFNRLINRMTDVRTKLAMYNWMAVRQIRVKRRIVKTRTQGAVKDKTIANDDVPRNPPRQQSNNLQSSAKLEDRRTESYKQWLATHPDADTPLPAFPPHPILYFTTISLQLTLGLLPTPSSPPQPPTPFHRTPGIPLLSASSRVVGSLHADSESSLPGTGEAIEIILVARSHKPTVGSALWRSYEGGVHEQNTYNAATHVEGDGHLTETFWALYIIWHSEIAQRRGVVQVLESALEDAQNVCVKSVLLG